MSVTLAVCFFNDGVKSLVEVLAEMGMPVGDFTSSALTRLDAERQKNAEKKQAEETKKRRKKRRRVRKGGQDDALEAEGVTYEAGGF